MMADLVKLIITGNKVAEYFSTNPEIKQEETYWCPLEIEEIKNKGLNIEEWKIKAYYPGLKERYFNRGPQKPQGTLDGYELIIEKIK